MDILGIVFYVFLSLTAIYVIFHIVDFVKWWKDRAVAVFKGILKLFGKGG